MRTLALATVLAGFAAAQTAEELTAMERFASGAREAVQQTQTIRSEGVSAAFTSVILSNGGREIRGLRIDLASGDQQERVYVEERFLPALIESLTGLGQEAMEPRFGCTGSCIFLSAMREGAHFFFASQCGRDLVVNTGAGRFRFADTEASRMRSAVAEVANVRRAAATTAQP
jgi:hypothetical protein